MDEQNIFPKMLKRICILEALLINFGSALLENVTLVLSLILCMRNQGRAMFICRSPFAS